MTFVPEVAHPVAVRDWRGVNQREDAMTYIAVRTAQTGANGVGVQDVAAYTLDGTQGQMVAFAIQERAESEGASGPGFDGSEDGTGRSIPMVVDYGARMSVRRLLPVECERVQGFPDGWTCVCGAGADMARCTCPDGPRYRALGNAVTVSTAEWIMRRIVAVGGA